MQITFKSILKINKFRQIIVHIAVIILFLGISFISLAQNIDTSGVMIDTSGYIRGDDNFNLIIAAEKGYDKEVLRILRKGADVNVRTDESVTALMYAVQNEYFDVCKILLLNGADPNLKPYSGVPAIIAAVKTGNLEITELLIRKDADINLADPDGVTPLMFASAFNMIDMTDMLLYYDAYVNATDDQGNTALIVAAYYGNTDIVKLLIDAQATLDRAEQKGFTALHCAAQNGNLDVAEILTSKGASIELKNNSGYSALSLAVLNNNTKLTEFLIEKGAYVNSKISSTLLPLNLAKNNKNDTIIGLLKNQQAKLNRAPAFNKYSINFDFNGINNNFMLGGSLSINDTRYGFSINAGYATRLYAKEILEKDTGNVFYQYWERRSYFNIGLTKRFDLYSWHKDNSLGIAAGGQLLYSYGSYRGTDEKPDNIYLFSPQVITYIKLHNIAFSFRYEYTDFKLIDASPHRFSFGIHFLIRGKKLKQSTKKVLWYI